MTLDQILAEVHKLSTEEKIRLIHEVESTLPSPDIDASSDAPTWTEEDIAALMQPSQKPFNGAQVVRQLLDGTLESWADAGIEDSVAWLEQQRSRRKRKFKWD